MMLEIKGLSKRYNATIDPAPLHFNLIARIREEF